MWWLIVSGVICIVFALVLLFTQPKTQRVQHRSINLAPLKAVIEFLGSIIVLPFFLCYLVLKFFVRLFRDFQTKFALRRAKRLKESKKKEIVVEDPPITAAAIRRIQNEGFTYRNK